MALVEPDERMAAAGFTSIARNLATATSPVLAGWSLQVAAWGLPFVISGAIKIVYDLSIYATFRKIRLPEESQKNRR